MSFFDELRKLDPHKAKDYDEIVQKIEIVAKRDPAYYRKQLLLLACLGYVYVFVVFLLINAALWVAWQLYSAIPALEDRSSDFIAIALLVALGFFSKFLIPFSKPRGITLRRKDVPALFEMLDRVARSLKAPKPHHVILQDNLNAGVFQQPLFGFIGWHTNYLLIGLPLMQALSPQQFEAVIAHEFAHLRGGDSKFSAWVYRIRNFWSDISDQVNRKGKRNFLFGRFFSWYGPFFKAFSFVHARAQEYESDRLAGKIVGAEHKAEALIWLTVSGYFLQDFWENIYRQTAVEKAPPDDVIEQQLSAIKTYSIGQDKEQVSQRKMLCWVSLQMSQETNNKSTHPSLSDRLGALEYTLPKELMPPSERATVFLGDRLGKFTQQMSKLWRKDSTTLWQKEYRRKQISQQRLRSLDKMQPSEMTVEERLKQALLRYSFQDSASAIPLLREIVESCPEHAVARYWLAHLLLLSKEQSNALFNEAIEHCQFVIKHNPALRLSAYYEIYTARFMRGLKPAYLKPAYKEQRWREHGRAWARARQERKKLDKAVVFISHNIPPVEVEQIADYFASYPEIKAAYIACKVVERFPEFPHYLIVLIYQFPHNAKDLPIPSNQLKQIVRDGLAFSGDYTLKLMNESPYLQQIKRVNSALIYER